MVVIGIYMRERGKGKLGKVEGGDLWRKKDLMEMELVLKYQIEGRNNWRFVNWFRLSSNTIGNIHWLHCTRIRDRSSRRCS